MLLRVDRQNWLACMLLLLYHRVGMWKGRDAKRDDARGITHLDTVLSPFEIGCSTFRK